MGDIRDNDRIMGIIRSIPGIHERTLERLKKRFDIGYQRYGQGVDVSSDTRKWGTSEDSWLEMLAEEVEDAFVYAVAHSLRTSDPRVEEILQHLVKIHNLVFIQSEDSNQKT